MSGFSYIKKGNDQGFKWERKSGQLNSSSQNNSSCNPFKDGHPEMNDLEFKVILAAINHW